MNPDNPADDPRHPENFINPPSNAQPGDVHQPPPVPSSPKSRFAPSTGIPNDGRNVILALLALLLLCGGVGAAVYIGVQKAGDALGTTFSAAQAAKQVGFFCTYIETQNYSMAYHLLSTVKQGNVSESDFAAHATALDASDGWVVTCAIDSDHQQPTLSSDGKSATAWIQVARSDNAKIVKGAMQLVFEDGEWKIDSADASLKLL